MPISKKTIKKENPKKVIEKEEVKKRPASVKVEKKSVKKDIDKDIKKDIDKDIKKDIDKEDEKSDRYFEAVGKRKSSIARIRLFTQGDKTLTVNDKSYDKYFSTLELQQIASASLERMKSEDRFRVIAKVKGGGIHSQAEAVRHGIARALIKFNPDFRKRLRRAGFVTRDPRKRERKKFGLKRARRAPQWSKR